MRSSDVITQLSVLLPQLTDKFTDDVNIFSITRSGTEMTAQCADKHDVEVGDAVAIVNAEMHLAAAVTRSGAIGTLVTTLVHDFTKKIAKTVTLSGAAEAEFIGTFTTIDIVDRNTITFVMVDSGPTTATGSPVLENSESSLRQYNTTYKVTSTPDDAKFTFNHSVSGLADPTGSILARVKPRISGAVEIPRAIAAYTQQKINKYWMFVVIDDVSASKGRAINSDAIDNIQRGNEYRQQFIQPFSIYVFIPVVEEIAARQARDIADDLFQSICKSLVFSKFDSGIFVGKQGPVQFVGHGLHQYSTSLYIHQYSFQQIVDLTFDDTVGFDLDVAFRDIDFTINPHFDLDVVPETGESMTATIDLDGDGS